MCLSGFECKAAGAGGGPGNDLRVQCSLHGKLRSLDCLQDNGCGQLICMDDRRCKGSDHMGNQGPNMQALMPGMDPQMAFGGPGAPSMGIAFDAFGNPLLGPPVTTPQFVDANGVAYGAQHLPGAGFGFPQGAFPQFGGAYPQMFGQPGMPQGMGFPYGAMQLGADGDDADAEEKKAKRSRSPKRKGKGKDKRKKEKKDKSSRKRHSRISSSSSNSSRGKKRDKRRKRKSRSASKRKRKSPTPSSSSS